MINVLPQEEKRVLVRKYWMRFSAVLCVLIMTIGVIATLLLLPSYFFSQSKEILAEKNLEEFNLNNTKIGSDNLGEVITDINTKLRTLATDTPEDTLANEQLKALLSLRPAGITFSQILFNEKSDGSKIFQVNGKATDRTTLYNLKDVLEAEPNFKNIDLPVSNFVKRSNIDFSITFQLK